MTDEYTIETDDGDEVDVRETVDAVEVSAERKVQLDQYEPIAAFILLAATKPNVSGENFMSWLRSLANLAMAEAERAAMERHEEYVREEAFGDQ